MLAYTHYEGDNRVMRYAETLAARGDDVEVIALRRFDGDADAVLQGVRVRKIQTRVRNERGKFTYAFRILSFLLRATALLTASGRRYDLIHVHSVPDFLVFAAIVPRLLGVRVILDIHDILPEFYANKFHVSSQSAVFRSLLLVERLSARVAHHVIIANDLWRERLTERSLSAAKCSVLLNYPDHNIFSPRPPRPADGRFIMLYPGSLNSHQGLDIAIRAFARISAQAPHAELHIYGSGPDRPGLEQMAAGLGLAGRILLRDPLPLREIANVMASADLGIVPKRADSFGNEAFSTKTLEFMSLGVPIVVADTAIDRFYFRDGVVRFFHSGDEDDLAAAMLGLIRDRDARERLARSGQEFARGFDWDDNKFRYLDVVDALTLHHHR